MIKSYVITFAFVTFRFVKDILAATTTSPNEDLLTLMAWASWVVPLFFVELFIQGKRLNK